MLILENNRVDRDIWKEKVVDVPVHLLGVLHSPILICRTLVPSEPPRHHLVFLPHRQAGQPALRLAGLPAYGAKTLLAFQFLHDLAVTKDQQLVEFGAGGFPQGDNDRVPPITRHIEP